jgi:hypothetical protein
MRSICVVDSLEFWPVEDAGLEVVKAEEYLTSNRFVGEKNLRVFNLCHSYKYQTSGYYVSLLAAARGHKPIPSIATIQDMKSPTLVRIASETLQELVQRSLSEVRAESFEGSRPN